MRGPKPTIKPKPKISGEYFLEFFKNLKLKIKGQKAHKNHREVHAASAWSETHQLEWAHWRQWRLVVAQKKQFFSTKITLISHVTTPLFIFSLIKFYGKHVIKSKLDLIKNKRWWGNTAKHRVPRNIPLTRKTDLSLSALHLLIFTLLFLPLCYFTFHNNWWPI